MVMKFLLKKQLRTQNSKIHSIKKVRKSAKRHVFSTPNLRTCESIGNPIKKNTQTDVFDFWQGHLSNSRDDFIRELLLFGKNVKHFLSLQLSN